MDDTKDYDKIFEEYWELEIKTSVPSEDAKESSRSTNMSLTDLQRVNKLEEELRQGLEFLTDKRLKFLSENDDNLSGEAMKVLLNRK